MPVDDDPRLAPGDANPDGWPGESAADLGAATPAAPHLTPDTYKLAGLAALNRELLDDESGESLGELLSTATTGFDRSKGEPWGPLLVLDEIGGGSFGKVYRAWDPALDHEVALKRLRLPAATSASHAASIVREGQLLARVRHPNVITVHGACEIDGEIGIWMEFVRGRTLEQIVRNDGQMSAQEASVVGESLCGALAAIHQAGLLHRDLKASNIMREAGGRIVVIDFGTSIEIDAGDHYGARYLIGTPLYMAPELFEGAPASAETDIYSLGVLLFYLTTGTYPVRGKSLAEIRTAHQTGRRRILSDLRPDLPVAFVEAVERAASPLPSDRYPSAGAMLRSLRAWAPGDSVGSEIPDKRSRRHTGLVLAAATVLAIVGILLNVPRERAAQPDRAPVIAVLPSNNSNAPQDESFMTGLAAVITAELSTFQGIVVAHPQAADDTRPLTDIAKELDLDYVIEGTAERNGSRRVVTLTITNPVSSAVRSSKRFEEDSASVFPLQIKIAEWLVDQIGRIVGKPVSAPPPPQITGNMQALEDYAQARRFLERRDVTGNIGHAIAALDSAISRDPRFALAHAALGEAYWQQYQETRDPQAAQAARDAALEALRLDPNQPMVRYALALIYQGTGRRTEAIDELQKAIVQQPSSDDLHRLLGRVYADEGRIDQAVGEFLAAIRLRPGFWDNYRALGLAYYDAGRYQDAISALTRLTELQPDNAAGYQMLGTSYHAIGDLPRALDNYGRANTLKPTFAAWSNIGTIRYQQRQFAEAASAYRESIRLRPEPAQFRNLGDALTRLGDKDGARTAYQTAIKESEARLKVERGDQRILALEAVCYAKLGDHARARAVIEKALAIGASGDVLYQKAVVLALNNDVQPALAALRLALESGFSPVLAAEDDDLAALHVAPEFSTIVGKKE